MLGGTRSDTGGAEERPRATLVPVLPLCAAALHDWASPTMVRRAVGAALDELGTSLAPEVIRVTVGVKLGAETGAIIARSSAEGNLRMQMEWDRRDDTG